MRLDRMRLGKALITPLDDARGPYTNLDSQGYQILLDYHGGPQPFALRSIGKVMQTGLCAYARDHVRFTAGLRSELGRLPGLELTGDYMLGASIEACFRASLACANRLGADYQTEDGDACQLM